MLIKSFKKISPCSDWIFLMTLIFEILSIPKNIRIKNNTGGMHVITDDDILKKRLSSNIHSKKYSNEMKKLDDLNISNFDILLADVEGKEYELLKGGRNKILKYKPIIIVELWSN